MTTHRPIETILDERLAAELLVESLDRELQAAREAHAGLAVGDVLISTSTRSIAGRAILVDRVEFTFSKPWVYGRTSRRDGTFGARSVGHYEHYRRPEPGELERLGVTVP